MPRLDLVHAHGPEYRQDVQTEPRAVLAPHRQGLARLAPALCVLANRRDYQRAVMAIGFRRGQLLHEQVHEALSIGLLADPEGRLLRAPLAG
jgi:hypothetical protein